MREIVQISSLFATSIGGSLFDDLCEIFPEGERPEHLRGTLPRSDRRLNFQSALPSDDSRTSRLIEVLQRSGMTPWSGLRKKAADEYSLLIFREFDESDLAACEFLALHGTHRCEDTHWENPVDPIRLVASSLSRKADLAGTGPNAGLRVVPDRVKRILETAGFLSLMLRPTEVRDGETYQQKGIPRRWEEFGEHWWHLTSDQILPPVSPNLALFDNNGKPIRDNFTNGCFRRDGAVVNPELRYRRVDLERTPRFDVAKTFETFGIKPHESGRDIVVSKRFYEFCRERKLKFDFVPVRIDEA